MATFHVVVDVNNHYWYAYSYTTVTGIYEIEDSLKGETMWEKRIEIKNQNIQRKYGKGEGLKRNKREMFSARDPSWLICRILRYSK